MQYFSLAKSENGLITELRWSLPEGLITLDVIEELHSVLDELYSDPIGKVVILGSENADTALGQDPAEIYEVYRRFPGGENTGRSGGWNPARRARGSFHGLLWDREGIYPRLMQLPKMTVFLAKGRCYDHGMYMALCCDFVIASDDLKLGNPRWMFNGADGDLSLLVLSSGVKRAKGLVLVDHVLTAQQAKAFKLVDLVLPEAQMKETVDALAETMSGVPRGGIQGAKRANESFISGMMQATSRGVGLSSMVIREGEFNFLRERRNLGLEAALQKAQEYARQ